MKYTNKHNLPQRVIDVIKGVNPDRPKPTNKTFHVTELYMPAYARNLLVNKWDDIVKDYSDSLLTAQGSSLDMAYDKYLPYNDGWDTQISFAEPMEGVTLVGTLDAYNRKTETLVSLKQTAVWAASYKIEDYTKQENCYTWFLNKKWKKVSKILVDVWLRNWQLKQSQWSHDYPKIPYEQIELEIWPIEKTEQFIKDQIHYLTMCKDPCTREDKWQKYAVMKNTNKTPSKNCTTKQEGELWIENYKKENPTKKDKFKIVDTPPLNCLSYCASRSVCPYARSLNEKN
jgi:hypothetical protein